MSTILTIVGYAALYLLLAGTLSVSEGATAVLVGILAGLWTLAIRHQCQNRFGVPRGLLRASASAVRLLLHGTWRATGILLSAAFGAEVRGRPLRVEFHPGVRSSAPERTRRALALLGASVAPDSYVVRLAHGREALLHSIGSPGARARDPLWLL
jgi:hypothetical protein